MPQNTSNNQKGGLTRAEVAEKLQQKAGGIARSKIAGELQRQKQLASREQTTDKQKELSKRFKRLEGEASDTSASKARRLAAAQELSRLQQEENLEEGADLSRFQTQWPEEGTELSSLGTDEEPAEMGRVPMEQEKDFGFQPQGEENAPLEQLPQRKGVEEPSKPKSTEGGGPEPTGEEKEGPFAKAGPLRTGAEEPKEKERAEKKPGEPGEEKPAGTKKEEAATGTANRAQAMSQKLEAAQEKGRNAAEMAKTAKGGLTGGTAGKTKALGRAVGGATGEAVASFYNKYKLIVWIAGFIAPALPWILGGLVILALLCIFALIVSYMINNPTATFFDAMWCGGDYFLGGNGFDCLFKKALEKAPEAIKAATEAKTP